MLLNPNNLNDIHIDENGEIAVAPNGDFQLSEGSEAAIETAMFRCKTVVGDFILEPECGASLEQVIGEPNSPETGALISSLIEDALTHDGFFSPDQLEITTMPIDANTIVAIVIITYDFKEASIATTIDLKEGSVSISRVI